MQQLPLRYRLIKYILIFVAICKLFKVTSQRRWTPTNKIFFIFCYTCSLVCFKYANTLSKQRTLHFHTDQQQYLLLDNKKKRTYSWPSWLISLLALPNPWYISHTQTIMKDNSILTIVFLKRKNNKNALSDNSLIILHDFIQS